MTPFDVSDTSDSKFKAALAAVVIGAREPFDRPGPATGWTHAAARGVMAELAARPEIVGLTEAERIDLVSDIALIVAAAGWAWFDAPRNEFF